MAAVPGNGVAIMSSTDTTETTPPDPTVAAGVPSPRAPRPTPSAARKPAWLYLVIMAVLIALMFAGVGIANAQLNPYVYDQDAIGVAAQGLADGKNLANYDPNLDLRSVRKAQIERMSKAPDVVIFGGSRWQEARSEIIPGGHDVYNAFVSNDQVEDMLAITNILDKAHRLPKTMVLSLRFVSVQGIPQRQTYDWKAWGGDYAEMAGKLGISPASYPDRAPVQQWSGQFNFTGLFSRWLQVDAAKHAPRLTTEDQTPDLDIIAADGSLHWSKASEAKFTRKFVDKAVDKEILTVGPTKPGIDPTEVATMGRLIDWLQKRGVKVFVVQTPYRPDYWQRIQSYPFAKTLHGLEQVALQLQAQHGAIAGNHFDPAPFPHCTLDEFVDHIHPRPPCLADMFAALPDLVTGAPR